MKSLIFYQILKVFEILIILYNLEKSYENLKNFMKSLIFHEILKIYEILKILWNLENFMKPWKFYEILKM